MIEIEKDYYQILGVSGTATYEDIRSSYKNLALRLHPDLSNDPAATARMQVLNEAYSVLRDQQKRAQYDLLRLAPLPVTPVIPVYPSEATQPIRRYNRTRPRRSKSHMQRVLLGRLTLLLRLVLVLVVLFLWSLLTGQVNMILLAGVVFGTLGVIVTMVWQVRRYILE